MEEQAPGSVEECRAALCWTRIWNWGQPDQLAGHRPISLRQPAVPKLSCTLESFGIKTKIPLPGSSPQTF